MAHEKERRRGREGIVWAGVDVSEKMQGGRRRRKRKMV